MQLKHYYINIQMHSIQYEISATVLGEILLVADQAKLFAVFFVDTIDVKQTVEKLSTTLSCEAIHATNPIIEHTKQELSLYLKNQLDSFTIPVALCGTDFQKSVWQSLTTIPYGQTTSYAHVAHSINKPSAVRAAGTAIGANKINIIVPCHRVIYANGDIGQYFGNTTTMNRKKYLLELESN